MEIKITKTTTPNQMPPEDKLGFGKVFTDHMFVMDYEEGKGWYDARIVPFGKISLHPASTVLHYGAEIFEGLKAYRREDGGVQLFRPLENIKRMNNSAERMSLPLLNEEDALEILETFVKLEERFVPHSFGTSFKINGEIVTPMLTGSILPGITRKSCIEVLKSLGYTVSERLLSVDELVKAMETGTLEEAWGCGTAAVVSPIGKLAYGEKEYVIGGGKIGQVTQKLYDLLTGIQWGKVEDTFGWVYKL